MLSDSERGTKRQNINWILLCCTFLLPPSPISLFLYIPTEPISTMYSSAHRPVSVFHVLSMVGVVWALTLGILLSLITAAVYIHLPCFSSIFIIWLVPVTWTCCMCWEKNFGKFHIWYHHQRLHFIVRGGLYLECILLIQSCSVSYRTIHHCADFCHRKYNTKRKYSFFNLRTVCECRRVNLEIVPGPSSWRSSATWEQSSSSSHCVSLATWCSQNNYYMSHTTSTKVHVYTLVCFHW